MKPVIIYDARTGTEWWVQLDTFHSCCYWRINMKCASAKRMTLFECCNDRTKTERSGSKR